MTAIFASIIVAALLLGGSALAAVETLSCKTQAAAAADNAALAAADALMGFRDEDPCELANTVAAANSVRLVECESSETAVRVVCVADSKIGVQLLGSARAGSV